MSGSVPALITMPRLARNTRGAAPSGPVTVTSPGAVIRPLPRANLPPLATNRFTATVSSQLSVASFLIRWATGAQSGTTSAEPAMPGIRRPSASRFAGPDHHLGRNAPPVRAFPADQPVLDADHGKPGLGQPPGEVLAAGAHADHDDVRLLGLHLPTFPGSRPTPRPGLPPRSFSPGRRAGHAVVTGRSTTAVSLLPMKNLLKRPGWRLIAASAAIPLTLGLVGAASAAGSTQGGSVRPRSSTSGTSTWRTRGSPSPSATRRPIRTSRPRCPAWARC